MPRLRKYICSYSSFIIGSKKNKKKLHRSGNFVHFASLYLIYRTTCVFKFTTNLLKRLRVFHSSCFSEDVTNIKCQNIHSLLLIDFVLLSVNRRDAQLFKNNIEINGTQYIHFNKRSFLRERTHTRTHTHAESMHRQKIIIISPYPKE